MRIFSIVSIVITLSMPCLADTTHSKSLLGTCLNLVQKIAKVKTEDVLKPLNMIHNDLRLKLVNDITPEEAVEAEGTPIRVFEDLAYQSNGRSIKKLSPYEYSRVNGWDVLFETPNCWGAVSMWKDTEYNFPASLNLNEFKKFLRSFYPLPTGSKLELGDIIVYKLNGEIVHAAIYINEEFLWHKPNAAAYTTYGFSSQEETLKKYSGESAAVIEYYR